MSAYYTVIMVLGVFSMLTMLVCVSSSGTLSRKKKNLFRLLFLSVITAAFCEWLGIYLQGTGSSTRILHILIKAAELSVAPSIGFLIAAVIETRYKKATAVFLILHAGLEILSGFFGFIYQVDAASNYTHAQYYWIYIAAYAISIIYGIYIVMRNIKKYQYGGVIFFLMILTFLLFGIIVQLCDSSLKVDFIAVSIASIMLYVFTLEMIQQTDELTGLINRRGYENYLVHMEETCIILMFDVDKFKNINDDYGHQFGDVCLKTVGSALRTNYAKYGRCFRIGGDEFCVIMTKELNRVKEINSEFFGTMGQYREKEKRMPYVSVGCVTLNPQTENIQDALAKADKMMYQYKEAHRRNCADVQQKTTQEKA